MVDKLVSLLQQLVEVGGPVVVLMLAISVLTLALVFYKIWQFRAARVGSHAALKDALTAWDQGERAAAQQHLARSKSYLRDVVDLGMATECDLQRLEAEAETRFARLERGFRVLDIVSQLAPLLGLFGTVLGMISAFQALQNAGSQVDPTILAGGIWVALLTTAVGLAIAMPTSVILTWFEGRMDGERVFATKALSMLVNPHVTAKSEGPVAQETVAQLAHA